MLDVTASAKPGAPKAVTTKHLAYALADQHKLTKKQSLKIMEDMVGMITKHLKKGERVKFAGLGILQVRSSAARTGRNPRPVKRSNQGQQKSRLPRQQGPQDGNLIAVPTANQIRTY